MQTLDQRHATVRVWDPLVRTFHWSLAAFFFIAYLSGDDWLSAHVYAGYTVAALIAFRLIWGVIGTRHARFTDFVTGPTKVKHYLAQLIKGRAPRYLGHNPAGAAMIVALLGSLAVTAFTGAALIAGDGSGPLAGTFVAGYSGDALKGVHELFANLTLLLVCVHVAGVVLGSLLHRENLVKAMWTGRKDRETTTAPLDRPAAPAGTAAGET